MAHSEIDAIRALLGSKPRPVGWSERRQRLDEVGSTWPRAADVKCEAVDCDGVPGEWSIAPDSEASRVLLYFHGGGYCSGSIVSHRRMVTEAGRAARMRTLAIDYRRAPEHPYPAAHEDALAAWRFLRRQGIPAASYRRRRRQRRRQPDARADQPVARGRRGLAGLRLAGVALDRPHDVGRDARDQGRRRSADPQGLSRRARGRLCAAADRPQGSADFAAVRRPRGLSARC